jgi:hypothetical protein
MRDDDAQGRPVASRFRGGGETHEIEGVTLVDVDIPFERMVAIMVKWSLAAIPAGIVVAFVIACLYALFRLVVYAGG